MEQIHARTISGLSFIRWLFTECLLCAAHWSRTWKYSSQNTGEVSALSELTFYWVQEELTFRAKAKLNYKGFHPWLFLIDTKMIQIYIFPVPFPFTTNIPSLAVKGLRWKGHMLCSPPTWPVRGSICVPRPGCLPLLRSPFGCGEFVSTYQMQPISLI